MNSPAYIPLRLHSEFSIEDGMVRVGDAVKRAVALNLPALGISDLMNVFAMVKFYKACRGSGIKPIIGADVFVDNPEQPEQPFRALLIAKNSNGYLRLSELLTEAYTGTDKDLHHAQLRQAWLEEGDNSGLICLSGAQEGEIGQALLRGHADAAAGAAEKYRRWFGDGFYLELQRLFEKPEYEAVVAGSLDLAGNRSNPLSAKVGTSRGK